MIMRITWGKLRSGAWSDFEQAYHTTVAGRDVKGLRGRWLAQDVNDSDGDLLSVYGRVRRTCGRMSRVISTSRKYSPRSNPILPGNTRRTVVM